MGSCVLHSTKNHPAGTCKCEPGYLGALRDKPVATVQESYVFHWGEVSTPAVPKMSQHSYNGNGKFKCGRCPKRSFPLSTCETTKAPFMFFSSKRNTSTHSRPALIVESGQQRSALHVYAANLAKC